MHTDSVFQYLKKHGQLRDSEFVEGAGIAISDVRDSLKALSARGDISLCSMTVFENGNPIEGFRCRISGYAPKPAPGRKPAANKAPE